MKTVHNERLKLTAAFLNGIAIAIFVIGTFAPAVQTALTMTVPGGARSRTVVIGAIWTLLNTSPSQPLDDSIRSIFGGRG